MEPPPPPRKASPLFIRAFNSTIKSIHKQETEHLQLITREPSNPVSLFNSTVDLTWEQQLGDFLPIESGIKTQPSSPENFIETSAEVDYSYEPAKRSELLDKEPTKAVFMFWSAIRSGNKFDSALRQLAKEMKQLDPTDDCIEAVKSVESLCSPEVQHSFDNIITDLYKRSGRIDEHIELLQGKLKLVEDGSAFGGKRTKIARSQGTKFHDPIEQQRSRLLGNLAWAYMQQENYRSAEQLYRKALSLEPDKNKQCNLAICLMNNGKVSEARFLLQAVTPSSKERDIADSYIKSYDRGWEMLTEFESQSVLNSATKRRS